MRTKSIICILAASLTLASCNDWLNVTSSNQVSDARLFSTRTGFLEALSGIYIDMASTDNYGMNDTWYAMDLCCMPYASTSNNYYTDLQEHRYTNSRIYPIIHSIWQGGYNVIANVNKTLAELEAHPEIVTDELERNLIHGELLGIRAYMHFDLMKMFGASSWTGEKASLLTIPYVRTYSKDPEVQRSYTATLELLHEDIAAALVLLEKDPVRGEVSSDFQEGPNVDGYWNNRNKHLNYIALKALLARVLVWEDKWDEAAVAAQEVIDEAFACSLVSWFDAEEMVKKTSSDLVDWTMSTEHIFCLESTDMYNTVTINFAAGSTSTDASIKFDTSDVDGWLFPKALIILGDLSPVEDVRGPALMLSYTNTGYAINKYYTSTSYPTEYRNKIPMIRLPEMYYIIAEKALRDDDAKAFYDALNAVRSHRGISAPLEESAYSDDSVLSPSEMRWQGGSYQLYAEYLKEFVGEGQAFYFIKRFMPYSMEVKHTSVSYIYTDWRTLTFPYPVEETTYGRVQEL
ncbi:MAG: RagB/SusD family nutrient uptake outer membrane protein [Bacteroidales bacterium]|nr:RagB/SusD family nutrient uptake outer membrane protein [Bacteroidales bacterium]